MKPFGKGFTLMFEFSAPIQWLPKGSYDPDTKLIRVIWLVFAVAVFWCGYVEHRYILLKSGYEHGTRRDDT